MNMFSLGGQTFGLNTKDMKSFCDVSQYVLGKLDKKKN